MLKRAATALAAVAALTTGVLPAMAGTTAPPPGNSQVAAPDRYALAVATSQKTFTPGVDMVVVATGQNFPDGLSGGAIAANAQGPLLLTPTAALPAAVRAELVRLKPPSVIISGGTSSVSGAVEQSIRAALPNAYVQRVGGADRYTVAANLSASYYDGGAQTIYIAAGLNYADAVAATPAAGLTAGPLLLADSTLPAATKAELLRLSKSGLVENVVILGGPSSVSDTVFTQVSQIFGPVGGYPRTVRVGGADRYAVAANLAGILWSGVENPQAKSAYYVNGLTWADALTAGAASAANDAPVLLTTRTCMPAATKSFDTKSASTLTSRVWIGGSASLTMSTNQC